MSSDPLDHATDLSENERATREAFYRAKAVPEQVRDENGNWETEDCVDCGLEIEPGRLDLGKIRCFTCQTLRENHGRMYR